MLKKINMKKRITIQEADTLLEKYYEGNTSTAEEKQLKDFLAQGRLPRRFDADKAILGYFAGKKQKPESVIIPFLRWASVAAILSGIILISKYIATDGPTSYAYINGQKYTNIQVVKEQALASLEVVSSSPDEVAEIAKNLK